jgi:hypothetical protein
MYSTCIFCHSNLGTNESVEHFPIGRRLAFDAARGRLWVVCRRCERWNLSPLEERWEAIEECERLFSSTRMRVSTDNIGLARARDGLELVRIGSPQRPELAAWRYGDQFGRRRRKHLVWTGAGITIGASLLVLGPMTGVLAASSLSIWNLLNMANTAYQLRRVRARLAVPDLDEPVIIRSKQLHRVSLVPGQSGWALRVPYEIPSSQPVRLASGSKFRASRWSPIERTTLIEGPDALRTAGKILPAINTAGANRTELDAAVRLVGEVGDPAELYGRYAARVVEPTRRRRGVSAEPGHVLSALPAEVRLALEMAAHEQSERQALEGELSVLEAAWKEAEEIAAIADEMFVSPATREKLAELREKA